MMQFDHRCRRQLLAIIEDTDDDANLMIMIDGHDFDVGKPMYQCCFKWRRPSSSSWSHGKSHRTNSNHLTNYRIWFSNSLKIKCCSNRIQKICSSHLLLQAVIYSYNYKIKNIYVSFLRLNLSSIFPTSDHTLMKTHISHIWIRRQ